MRWMWWNEHVNRGVSAVWWVSAGQGREAGLDCTCHMSFHGKWPHQGRVSSLIQFQIKPQYNWRKNVVDTQRWDGIVLFLFFYFRQLYKFVWGFFCVSKKMSALCTGTHFKWGISLLVRPDNCGFVRLASHQFPSEQVLQRCPQDLVCHTLCNK